MTVPKTISAEYQRAMAAEAALQKQIDALKAAAPAPPPVIPAPTGELVPWTPTDSPAYFASLVKDKTVAAIRCTAGAVYKMPELYLDGDRGGVALDIDLNGAHFQSTGKTLTGQFFFGLNTPLVGPVRMHDGRLEGIRLAQAGLLEMRRATDLLVERVDSAGTIRDTTYATRSILTWHSYLSSKAGGGCHKITMRDCQAIGDSGRTTSFIQLDSGEEDVSDIVLENMACSGMAYAFYGNILGQRISLDHWNVADSGYNGVALSFRQGSGTYHDIVHSEAIEDIAPGMTLLP